MRERQALHFVVPATTGVVVLSVLVVYVRTMAPTITWQHSGADSGDLVTAAINLGIPHPTGYPLYTLIAHLFTRLTWAEPARSVTLFSALAASLAVGVTFYTVCRWLMRQEGLRGIVLPAAWAGAGLLAFGELLWSQATIAEVYSLSALLFASLLAVGLTTRQWLRPYFLALLVGFALAHHVTIVLLLPALWPYADSIRRWLTVRRAVLLMLCVLPGLLCYAMIPLAGRDHPIPYWGQPDSVAGFLWLVTGTAYRRYLGAVPAAHLLERLSSWAGIWVRDLGVPGLALAFLGLCRGLETDRPFTRFGLSVVAFYTAYAMLYATADSYLYLLPAAVIAALWTARGAVVIVVSLRTWLGLGLPGRVATLSAILVLIALPIASLATRFTAMDISQDREAFRFAEGVLAAAAPSAIVISSGDLQTFPLWYVRYGLRQRPDVVVVDRRLLAFDWYRDDLARRHPELDELAQVHDAHHAVAHILQEGSLHRPLLLAYADELLLSTGVWATADGRFFTLVREDR